MRNHWVTLAVATMLIGAMPAVVQGEELSLKGGRVSVRLGPEVTAAPEKVEAIKEYRIMERLRDELGNNMHGMPASAKATIVITKLHLRSGRAVFFGGRMSGDDFIETDITISEKGKPPLRFVIEAVNRKSSRSQVPPRRVNNMIRKFGSEVARELHRNYYRRY